MLKVQTEVEAEDLDVSMARSMKPRNRRIGVFWARHLMTEAVSIHFNTTIFIRDYVDYYRQQPCYIDRFFQNDKFGLWLRSQPWGSEQVEFLCQKASESGNFH